VLSRPSIFLDGIDINVMLPRVLDAASRFQAHAARIGRSARAHGQAGNGTAFV